jgi:hypothetical protein
MLSAALGILSATLALVIYAPYALDIAKGRVRPSRSSRAMLTIVLAIALLQQMVIGGGWVLAVTVGELVGSIAILGLSWRHGIGGLARTDLVCYGLFVVSLAVWLLADNVLWALHLSILADFIAFAPTLIKSWYLPKSETPLFYVGGVVSTLLSIGAAGSLSYAILVFPAYLALVNTVQLAVMYWPHRGSPQVNS